MAWLLIVDDNADGREALCTFLTKAGHEVECAPDGRDALAVILRRTPDLIILDLCMPQTDGAGLLEVMRSYLRLQSLPVVILTGLPDGPAVDRARHLKVNAILLKGRATLDEIAPAVQRELRGTLR